MPAPNVTASDRLEALLEFHKKQTGLIGDPATLLWHVISDMLEWCDEQQPRVAFDDLVYDVRTESI